MVLLIFIIVLVCPPRIFNHYTRFCCPINRTKGKAAVGVFNPHPSNAANETSHVNLWVWGTINDAHVTAVHWQIYLLTVIILMQTWTGSPVFGYCCPSSTGRLGRAKRGNQRIINLSPQICSTFRRLCWTDLNRATAGGALQQISTVNQGWQDLDNRKFMKTKFEQQETSPKNWDR